MLGSSNRIDLFSQSDSEFIQLTGRFSQPTNVFSQSAGKFFQLISAFSQPTKVFFQLTSAYVQLICVFVQSSSSFLQLERKRKTQRKEPPVQNRRLATSKNCSANYPPTNFAGLFSRNAVTPSLKSLVFPDSICVSLSRSSWLA